MLTDWLAQVKKVVLSMPLQLYEKEEILDACFMAFAQNGYEHTSTAMLAQSAGVSKALLFHHFGSKKELYLQVLDRLFERGKREMGFDTISERESFFEAREKASIAKLDYHKRNPGVYKFWKEAFYETPDGLKEEIDAKYGALMAVREKERQKSFDRVSLRPGVDRDQAFKLVKLALDYFDDKYLAELADKDELSEEHMKKFMEERNSFLSMIRYGIEEQ